MKHYIIHQVTTQIHPIVTEPQFSQLHIDQTVTGCLQETETSVYIQEKASWQEPVEDMTRSYLRIRDLGEDGGQALRQQHRSPAPEQELRGAHGLLPNHSLPVVLLSAPCPVSSSSSSSSFVLCLCGCSQWRRVQDKTTMALQVIDYFPPIQSYLLLCLLHCRNQTSRTLSLTENGSSTMEGASLAVRVH